MTVRDKETSTSRITSKQYPKLSDLFGALPATQPFSGKEAVRDEVGKALGHRHKKGKAE